MISHSVVPFFLAAPSYDTSKLVRACFRLLKACFRLVVLHLFPTWGTISYLVPVCWNLPGTRYQVYDIPKRVLLFPPWHLAPHALACTLAGCTASTTATTTAAATAAAAAATATAATAATTAATTTAAAAAATAAVAAPPAYRQLGYQ